MIVVNSNILVYLYLPDDFTEAAEALLECDPDWAAPVLWRSEFRNILAGYVLRGSLSFGSCACARCCEMKNIRDCMLVRKWGHDYF